MSRLTDINKCIVHYKKSYTDEEISNIIVKLGKLEDLEEQLGCPLEVIFEAILNGVWVEVDPMDIDIENPQYMYLEEYVKLEKDSDETLCLNCHNYVDELKLSDYKKTWWLKEDRSE